MKNPALATAMALALALALLVTLTGAAPATGSTGTTGPAPSPPQWHHPSLAADRAALIRVVNAARADVGCPRVRPHGALHRAAQEQSRHMARSQRLSHDGPGGSGPGGRLAAVGYDLSRAGENIVAGSGTPYAAVRAWLNSPEHRSSLLACSFRHAGVGRRAGANGPWWTLLLAAPR